MTLEEAANVIAQVCGQWKGTIAEGDLIREAYQTLTAAAGVDPTAVATAAPVEPAKPPTPNRAARRKAGPTKRRTPPGK